ncbi:WXG100 family type VII secretion target [Catenulispora yoronensis]
MAGNLSVTYQDMRDAGRQLTTVEGQIQDQLKQAQNLISNLVHSGFVTDAASKAFDQAYSDFTQGATKTISALTQMNQYLNTAADRMQETDSNLAQSIGGGH